MERRFITRLETLPDKVRLATTRKKFKSLNTSEQQNDEAKETLKELDNDEKEIVGADHISSVYGIKIFKTL